MADDEVDMEDEDFYAVLNCRKDASEDELKVAHRRMCVLYHPDKHNDAEKKRIAVQLFNKVQKAYEVLSNPETRMIYDVYGHKGLVAGWEVVERKRTPLEIQEEYERLQREREERRLQQRTNPKGSISVGIDATDLFDRYEEFLEERTLPHIEVSSMTISQSIEAPLTRRDTATLAGSLSVRNGNGSGNVSFSMRRVLSHKAWGEVEVAAGNGPVIMLRGFRNISKHSYGTLGLTANISENLLIFGLQSMVARQLDKYTVGYITLRLGFQSSINSTIVRETNKSRAVATVQLGLPSTFVVMSYTRKLMEGELKLKAALRAGMFGTIVDYGVDKKVSEHSRLSATMSIGSTMGVQLKIKLQRSTQSYSFPITLSEVISPAAIFYGTVVPVAAYWAINVLVIKPFLKKEKEKEAEMTREKHAKWIAEKRKDAENSISLMRQSYERIVEFESSRQGLVIMNAWYGHLVSFDDSNNQDSASDSSSVIDVTVPIQCQVKDSRLFLTEAAKHGLSGFYDPCPGEEKMLRIRYEFRNAVHEVTIRDDEALKLPKQSHRLSS